MAFFRNDAVNRVNLHSGVQALAQGAGGIFFLVYMLEAGVSVSAALLAQTAILAGRFIMRPAMLPLAKRLGLKPMVIIGTLGLALQYPLLAEIDGVGTELLFVCIVASIGEVFYWPCYNAYFAAIGDAAHRGHQVSAREALVAMVGIAAPLLGTWALVMVGARPMFAAVGMVQALAVVPLLGAPKVAVKTSALGAFRAARLSLILCAADGWLDAWFILVWQIALFTSLGESISAYGGAMALAALVGAGCGMILGRHVDQGYGRRTVVIAYTFATAVVLMRALSFDSAWLAVISNALGALVLPLISPAQSTAIYNLAKASPCPMRFIIVCEGGWDVGCASACLLGAALAAAGVSLSLTVLFALPALAVLAYVLRRYFDRGAVGASHRSVEARTQAA